MSKSPTPADDPVHRLVRRLHEVRLEQEGQPAARRRAALARELDLQLAEVPAAERAAMLERAMGTLRPASTAGDEGGAAAARLQSQLDAMRADREALAKERDALRVARDALLRENATMRGELETRGGPPSASPAAGGSFEAFRSGLKDAVAGKKVEPEKLGLGSTEVRLFRLTQELVNFIYMLERARIMFLNQVEVGQAGLMGTQLLKGYQDQVRKQILAVLNDEEGSIRKLRKTMDAQNRFILGIPDAFQGAIPTAVAGILAELEPDPILARSRKILTDYERAWGDFSRTHSDLTNLTPDEIWDRYFKQAFKIKLGEWTKSEG